MTVPPDNSTIPGVAHDIRQMLTVITGRVGLLLERYPDPELRRHLLAVEMAAADAAAMVGRLPGVGARLGSGPARLLDAAMNSCSLVLPPDGRPWQRGDESGPEGRWAAEFQIPGDLWAEVPAQLLREVLNNLLTNALEVMPAGGGIVMRGSASAGRVRLVVQDTGPGVPRDQGEAIFAAGFTTSGQVGRGLGLAGCRLLLEEQGGTLFLDPTVGPGAAFVLDLPQCAAVTAPEVEDHTLGKVQVPDPGEIFVVDDEPSVRDMLSDVMGELGWRPTLAENADQARELFRPGRFPLALLDLSLPGMSGLELARDLRRQDPKIVLVLVTGWGNEDILARASAEGIDFSEEKPLTVGKIRAILGKAGALFQERGREREES